MIRNEILQRKLAFYILLSSSFTFRPSRYQVWATRTFLINNLGQKDQLLVRYIVALLEIYFTVTVQCSWIGVACKSRSSIRTKWSLPGIECRRVRCQAILALLAVFVICPFSTSQLLDAFSIIKVPNRCRDGAILLLSIGPCRFSGLLEKLTGPREVRSWSYSRPLPWRER